MRFDFCAKLALFYGDVRITGYQSKLVSVWMGATVAPPSASWLAE
jgi:hypothetical protein